MTQLTARQVGREALRLADLYPNARYQHCMDEGKSGTCWYTIGDVENGPPDVCGCLFGQALRNLVGEDPGKRAILRRADESEDGAALTVLMRSLGVDVVEPCPELNTLPKINITKALESSQSNQDKGVLWGKAVEPLRIYFAQPELVPTHTIKVTDEELRMLIQALNYASDRSYGLAEEQQYNGLLHKLPTPGSLEQT